MKLLEYQGKRLLSESGITIPDGAVVSNSSEAAAIAATLGGKIVIKAQVPTGKRGKAGAIRFAETAAQAQREADDLLGSSVDGFIVTEVIVEQALPIARELYAAILNDPASKGPLLLFSTQGGMDIEEVNSTAPEKVLRHRIDIRTGLSEEEVVTLLSDTDLPTKTRATVAASILRLYEVYRRVDADLVEVNPLVLTEDAVIAALDAKISLDPGALARHEELVTSLGGSQPASETRLEREGRKLGLQFIELDGDVGVLANGAGLTMTTLDAVNHYGGQPANFLEIGGDAYTKATPALQLLLNNPNVRSLLVNFCGAFARTDVMTRGVVDALTALRPNIPVFFSIHGTGEEEAIQIVREVLGTEPYDQMDDAVKAAVSAARTAREEVKN
ncbi:succinate--CoA ligase subunit beta [Rhodococcus opacus]|uniref:Succinyl-CoA ligase subunit beta n=1 Tax=Rhodococcus opacus M213 TaxID=1129896 RepID=K8X9D3_RHOOP|nr:succinate--CoA ligase subunit beta [Rhodococcus opacus]EKT78103.1 succinyl-CoA ligase subunit beta [Rhodococcus opacus M213]